MLAQNAAGVLCIAHSLYAAERAEHLLAEVPGVEFVKPPPGVRGVAIAAWWALSSRADVLYLVNMGKTTTVAAMLGRLRRKRVILDTGHACYALTRALGARGAIGPTLHLPATSSASRRCATDSLGSSRQPPIKFSSCAYS